MASAPRDYMADEPVFITSRCVLRVPFLQRKAMKTEIRRQLSRWAPKCGVEDPAAFKPFDLRSGRFRPGS